MKNKTPIVFFVIIVVLAGQSCMWESQKGRQESFDEQLGTYQLDIQKTNLKRYEKDSSIYKNLQIVFNADSTFKMNMKVPFMYDSIGTWEAGNMKEWNYLKYKNFDYSKNGTGEQFTRPEYPDSSFLLNSSTPQIGAEFIGEIYFKKVSYQDNK